MSRSLVYDDRLGTLIEVRVYADRNGQHLPVIKTLTRSIFADDTYDTIEAAIAEVRRIAKAELEEATEQLNKINRL